MAKQAVKVLGLGRLNRKFKSLDNHAKAMIKGAMASGGLTVRKRIIEKLSQPGKGKFYRKGQFGRTTDHRASAPGDPPATDTGALKRSIHSITRVEKDKVTTTVGSFGNIDERGQSIGKNLEYGTSKVAPRPWLQTSFNETKELARKKILEAFKKATKKVRRR
jgi:hypothetical protein